MTSDVVRGEIGPSFAVVPFKFPSLATSGATIAVPQNGVSNTESYVWALAPRIEIYIFSAKDVSCVFWKGIAEKKMFVYK